MPLNVSVTNVPAFPPRYQNAHMPLTQAGIVGPLTVTGVNQTLTGLWVPGLLAGAKYILVLTKLTAKTMAAGTFDFYLQSLMPDGLTPNDLWRGTQVTSVAVANGNYLSAQRLGGLVAGSGGYTAVLDAAMGAGAWFTNADHGPDARIKIVSASLGGTDTLTFDFWLYVSYF